MKILQIFSFLFILTSSVLYLIYSKKYYVYCVYASQTRNYMVEGDKMMYYVEACGDMFKYREHSILQYFVNVLYDNVTELDEDIVNSLAEWIKTQGPLSFKLELQITKFLHMTIYFLLLYIVLIKLPNILMNILIAIANYIFYIILLTLLADGVLSIYLDINIDPLRLISNPISLLRYIF
jgi:hypothetical protein